MSSTTDKHSKSLQFLVTVEGVPDDMTRSEVKRFLEGAATGALLPFVRNIRVVRYNLPIQIRRARDLERAARDVIAKALDPAKAREAYKQGGK